MVFHARKALLLAGRLAFAAATIYLITVETINRLLRSGFNMELDGDIWILLAASDPDELRTFLRLYASGTIIAAATLGLVTAIVVTLALRLRRRALAVMAASVLVGASASVFSAGSLRTWKPLYFAYDTFRSVADYRTLVAAGRWTAEREAQTAPASAAAENLLFIIGESASADHLSAYGYPLATSPRLADGRAALLGPLTATHPDTARALIAMLTNGETTLCADFRLHGYRTALLSAQSHWERYGIIERLVFDACETKHYLADDGESRPRFDEELIALVAAEIRRDDQRPFAFFIHLTGSHFDPAERVPPTFAATPGLNAYDRSLAYTDEVVDALVALAPENTITIYVSDHGESPDSPRGWRDRAAPSLWRVPFAVWPAAAGKRFANIKRTDEILPRLRPAHNGR